MPSADLSDDYLDERRGHIVDGPVIRYMHQEMSCLSAKGWAWALPHYLPYCLTPEAEYNEMETEFLIYNFGCSDKYKDNMRTQLSCLTMRQLQCLILFNDDVWLWQETGKAVFDAESLRGAPSILGSRCAPTVEFCALAGESSCVLNHA